MNVYSLGILSTGNYTIDVEFADRAVREAKRREDTRKMMSKLSKK